MQAEQFGPHLGPGQPPERSRIVRCSGGAFVSHLAAEEAVRSVHRKAGKYVHVGQGEKEVHGGHFQTGLLAHLAPASFVHSLAGIHKSARQVERSLGRFERTAHYEQFAACIFNHSYGGGCRIVVVSETTGGAVLAAGVVLAKIRRAAARTKAELAQRMLGRSVHRAVISP